jgi:tetratricopeptide (TPR) repeat protein
MTADVRELEAERDFLLQSIEDLDREHVTGALDDQEYIDLRDQHVVRAAAVLRALNSAEREPATASRPAPSITAKATASWLRRRQRQVWALGVVALIAVCGVGIAAVMDERRDGDTITGNTADSAASLLADAQRQTAEGKASDAVKTYDKVLEIDAQNVQALTYRGWLLNLAGISDEGLASIERAIAIQPTYADAHFFKGYILLNVKQDPAGAIAELNAFLANNPPQEMVPLVQQVLKDAEARRAAAAAR